MRFLKTSIVALFLTALLIPASMYRAVHSQEADSSAAADQANVAAAKDATYTPGSVDLEGVPADDQSTYSFKLDGPPEAAKKPPVIGPNDCRQPVPAEAKTGFDDKTNDLVLQGTFDTDKGVFEEVDDVAKGLGPVYNAQSCKECHQNPVTGAISQINELRAGHNVFPHGTTTFVDAPGGSLINDRGIPTPNYNGDPKKSAKVQERVPPLFTAGIIGGGPAIPEELNPVRTFRTSLNTLGDGFVEAIADGTLVSIANNQPGTTSNQVHGLAISVPVLEAPGQSRIGRFGWKNQHGSLLSFSADAYLNEIGITNFLILTENTSLGRFVGFGSGFDLVPDNTPCTNHPMVTCGEDKDEDIRLFAEFMRATKAPPTDPDIQAQYQADVQAGGQLFVAMFDQNNVLQYSCSVCHVPSITTAPACTPINGGAFSVPAALANKTIHPFSDFLLHDIGTGDGIVQNGGPVTRTMVRTPPLWGVRTRDRLMHDGASLTFDDAIRRHLGEAAAVRARYLALTTTQQHQLVTFLESL
jgi:CxxC motif-containing protein (DUF1111 family)